MGGVLICLKADFTLTVMVVDATLSMGLSICLNSNIRNTTGYTYGPKFDNLKGNS